MGARETQPSEASRLGSGTRTVGEREAAVAEPEASEYRLSDSLFTPLQAVEEELLNLIEAYSTCLDSLGACGKILRHSAGNWSVESREQNVPPPVAFWRELREDVRDLKLDDLRGAVQQLPHLDGETPHASVDEIGRLLAEARADVVKELSNDPMDNYRRADRVDHLLLDLEETLLALARKIRKRAVEQGKAVQSAVMEILREIKIQKDQELGSGERHRPEGRRVATFASFNEANNRQQRRRAHERRRR